jgi:hypothetical protein
LEVAVAGDAPIQLIKSHITQRQDQASLETMTVMKSGGQKIGPVFGPPLLDLGFSTPTQVKELRISELALGLCTKTYITNLFNISTLTSLSLHRCRAADALLKSLRALFKENSDLVRLTTIRYWHLLAISADLRDAFIRTMLVALQKFVTCLRGLKHLVVQFPLGLQLSLTRGATGSSLIATAKASTGLASPMRTGRSMLFGISDDGSPDTSSLSKLLSLRTEISDSPPPTFTF